MVLYIYITESNLSHAFSDALESWCRQTINRLIHPPSLWTLEISFPPTFLVVAQPKPTTAALVWRIHWTAAEQEPESHLCFSTPPQ